MSLYEYHNIQLMIFITKERVFTEKICVTCVATTDLSKFYYANCRQNLSIPETSADNLRLASETTVSSHTAPA